MSPALRSESLHCLRADVTDCTNVPVTASGGGLADDHDCWLMD